MEVRAIDLAIALVDEVEVFLRALPGVLDAGNGDGRSGE